MKQAILTATLLLVVGWGSAQLALAQTSCNPTGPFPQNCDQGTGYECINGTWVCPAINETALTNPLTGGGIVDPNEIFSRVAAGFLIAIGAATMFFTVLGGYIILTAAGNSERFQTGKKTITYAIIGMIVVVGSYALLSLGISVFTSGKGLPTFDPYRLTDPLGITSPQDIYGSRLAKFFVSGLGALTVLVLVWGGLQWVVAAGNEEKIKKARQTLSYAFIGAMLVMGSYLLVNFVYTPIHNLLSTGSTPPGVASLPPEPAATAQVACFRRDTGKNYGATCAVESYNDCLKPSSGKQRGEIVRRSPMIANASPYFTDCTEVGACTQNSPGTAFHNRVNANECLPNDLGSIKKFSPMNRGLSDGTCPFMNQVSVNEGDSNRPYYQCYANISFSPGVDLPASEDTWACVREQQVGVRVCSGGVRSGSSCSSDGQCGMGGRCVPKRVGNGMYDCTEELVSTCRRETPNQSHFSGNFYHRRFCDEVGYCALDWSGHYECKDGVVAEQCTRLLFPSVGVPVPPWGCGYYDEVAGACYVPQSGITFNLTGPNGKHCPLR